MANKRSKGQLEILKIVLLRNRLPTETEVFDVYVGFVVKERCKDIVWPSGTARFEKNLDSLHNASRIWYASALGSLVIRGELNIKESNDEV